MGHLVNPLGRQLGDKNYLFWSNNFSFFFNYSLYRKNFYVYKFFFKLFKYFFELLRRLYKFPKIYYQITYNFGGQAIDFVNINTKIFGYAGFDYIFSLKSQRGSKIDKYITSYRLGKKFVKFATSRLKLIIRLFTIRYIRLFNIWRFRFLRRYIIKYFAYRKNKRKRLKRFKALTWMMKNGSFFKLLKRKYKRKYPFRLNLSNFYFIIYFKFIRLVVCLKLFKLLQSHLFSKLLVLFLHNTINKLCYVFSIKYINIKLDNYNYYDSLFVRIKELIRFFYWLSYKKNVYINFVFRLVTRRLIRLKVIKGFKLIACGRFFKRGRALYRSFFRGTVPFRNRFKFVNFFKRERIKLLGLCSIYLWVYLKKKFDFIYNSPLTFFKMNYLKLRRIRIRRRRRIRRRYFR